MTNEKILGNNWEDKTREEFLALSERKDRGEEIDEKRYAELVAGLNSISREENELLADPIEEN